MSAKGTDILVVERPVGSIHIAGHISIDDIATYIKSISNVVESKYSLNSGYHYSGYEKKDGTFLIKRFKGGVYEYATTVANLEADWDNRETLIYTI